jgi:hypothetical protein
MSRWRRFFTGVTETGDRVPEPGLQTRYFRGQSREMSRYIAELPGRHPAFRLIHHDAERGEVMLEYQNPIGLKHDVVVTVFALSPVRMAVDVHAALRGRMVDLGWNHKLIQAIYDDLEQSEFQRDTEVTR